MTRPLQNAHNTLIADLSLMSRRDEFSAIPTHEDAIGVSQDIAEVGMAFRRWVRTVTSEMATNGGDVSIDGYLQEVAGIFAGLSDDARCVGEISADREQSRLDDMKTDLMRERA